MTQFVIESMIRLLMEHKMDIANAVIGIFGISYKENVIDVRNSLALKLLKELKEYGFTCLVHDPLDYGTSLEHNKIRLERFDSLGDLSVAIVAVAHDFYQNKLDEILTKCKSPKILMDIPNVFVDSLEQKESFVYWSL